MLNLKLQILYSSSWFNIEIVQINSTTNAYRVWKDNIKRLS